MPSDGVHLDSAFARELLERQDMLQAEAWRTLDALDLAAALASIGPMEVIGSLATGLMVWRDIDLHVVAPGLSASVAHEAMARYFGHPKIGAIRYRYDHAAQTQRMIPTRIAITMRCFIRAKMVTSGRSTSPSGSPTRRMSSACQSDDLITRLNDDDATSDSVD